MANNEVRTRVTAKDDATKTINNVRDAWRTFQKEGSVGVKAGLTAAAATKGFSLLDRAISTGIDTMFASIDAASKLSESQSKVNVVFGQSAGEIERWASKSSTAFGQSKQAALEAVGTYGNLFQAFGVGQQEAAKMSKSLVELAADLASFNNTSVDDALIALRAGLSGETEPLKRYGIALSDARMRQELMAQGVKNLGATLTPLQKSTAAYAIIMKDSSLAQGDFARTSESLANKQRTLDAKMQDLAATLGGPLADGMSHAIDGVETLGREAQKVVRDLDDVFRLIKRGSGQVTSEAEEQTDVVGNLMLGWEALVGSLRAGGNTGIWLAQKEGELAGEIRDAALATRQQDQALEDSRESWRSAATAPKKAADAVEDFGEQVTTTRITVKRDLRQIVDAFNEARNRLEDAANEAADAIYDPIITKGDLAALQVEKQEQRKIAASKNSTKEQIADAKQRLAEISKEEFTLRARLIGLTGVLSKDAKGYLADLVKRYKSATGEARADLLLLIRTFTQLRLAALQAAGAYSVGATGKRATTSNRRASGGPVVPGQTYTVGEEGVERLVMYPGGGGFVIPNGKTGGAPMAVSGGASGGMTLVPIPVPQSWTPAQQAAWVNEAGPAMVDYLRRRGLV